MSQAENINRLVRFLDSKDMNNEDLKEFDTRVELIKLRGQIVPYQFFTFYPTVSKLQSVS